jgi:hypothetical protein
MVQFTKILLETISYNQLERYFSGPEGTLTDIVDHYTLVPDIEAIRTDMASDGGLKLSHAQRRMLVVLVALWEGRIADDVFKDGIGSLPKIIQSMDRNNRELFAELVVLFPGWGS